MVRFALFALVASALTAPGAAMASGWFSDLGKAKEVTLGEILRNPTAYVDVDVKVKVYFDATGDSYNPYFTRFTEAMYGNFSAWPINARLYEKRDFQRSYPLFFVARHTRAWKKLRQLDRFTTVELTGTVRDVFRGQPWIEVSKYHKLGGGLDADDIRNVVAGDAYFLAGRYAEAAEHYADAASTRYEPLVRADIYRKLGDARFQTGDYRRARRAYERALEARPDSEVLQRGVHAATAAVARMKARDEEAAGGEVEQPAPHGEPVVSGSTSDVDEIIKLLEDPAEVEAEVEAWKLELAKRADRARAETGAETVAGEEEQVEEAPVEAAPEDEQPAEEQEAPADEEAPEEQPAEEAPEEIVEEKSAPVEAAPAPEEEVVEQPAEEVEQPGAEAPEEVVEQPAEEDEQPGAEAPEEVIEQPEEQPEEQPAEDGMGEDLGEEEAAPAEEQPAEEQPEEQPAEEAPVEAAPEAEQPAEEETAPAEEQPAEEQPAGGEEAAGEEQPAEEAGEPEEEDGAEGRDEEATPENAVEDAPEEAAAPTPADEGDGGEVEGGEPAGDVGDGCGEEVVQDQPEEPVHETAEESAGEEPVAVVEPTTEEEPKVEEPVEQDPMVVKVGDRQVRLPRLPFFGCEDVTLGELRDLVAEILRNPEQ